MRDEVGYRDVLAAEKKKKKKLVDGIYAIVGIINKSWTARILRRCEIRSPLISPTFWICITFFSIIASGRLVCRSVG